MKERKEQCPENDLVGSLGEKDARVEERAFSGTWKELGPSITCGEDLIFLVRSDGTTIDVTARDSHRDPFVSVEKFLKVRFKSDLPKATVDMIAHQVARAMDSWDIFTTYFETMVRGEVHYLEIRFIPFLTDQVMVAIKDLTGLRDAIQTLRVAKERARHISELATEGIVIHENGIIIDANDAFAKMAGSSLEALRGRSFFELEVLDKDSAGKVKKMGQKGSEEPYEVRTVDMNGAVSYYQIRGKGFVYNGKRCRAVVIWDITRLKEIEAALKQNMDLIRKAFDEGPIGMALVDMDFKPFRVNRMLCDMLGYTMGELMDLDVWDITHPADIKIDRALNERLIKGEIGHYSIDKRFITKDKATFWAGLSVSMVHDEKGEPQFGLVMIHDISERKRREEELLWRMMRFRLEDRNLYIVKEPSPMVSIEAFNDLLKIGYRGLIITRTMRKELEPFVKGDFETVWLQAKSDKRDQEKELREIERWLSEQLSRTVILIERMDFLITKYGFKRAISFIHSLKDLVSVKGMIALIAIDPTTMDARELRLLEKECIAIEPMPSITMEEDMMEVVRFIYERNLAGVKPSYKDIGVGLGLSPPTVRRKVRSLIHTHTLEEVAKGRTKVLTLTEKGRRLFRK